MLDRVLASLLYFAVSQEKKEANVVAPFCCFVDRQLLKPS